MEGESASLRSSCGTISVRVSNVAELWHRGIVPVRQPQQFLSNQHSLDGSLKAEYFKALR
jgi:hypothetical protein